MTAQKAQQTPRLQSAPEPRPEKTRFKREPLSSPGLSQLFSISSNTREVESLRHDSRDHAA